MGAFDQSMQQLVETAAEAGVERPWLLADLSPREIELELKAHSARIRRENEQIDLLAWLIGRYVLCAVHAPRRYPRRPDSISQPRRRMNDDEMKRAFTALAQQRRE